MVQAHPAAQPAIGVMLLAQLVEPPRAADILNRREQPQGHQQLRSGRRPARRIAPRRERVVKLRQVQPLDHRPHGPGRMVRRQPLLQTKRLAHHLHRSGPPGRPWPTGRRSRGGSATVGTATGGSPSPGAPVRPCSATSATIPGNADVVFMADKIASASRRKIHKLGRPRHPAYVRFPVRHRPKRPVARLIRPRPGASGGAAHQDRGSPGAVIAASPLPDDRLQGLPYKK